MGKTNLDFRSGEAEASALFLIIVFTYTAAFVIYLLELLPSITLLMTYAFPPVLAVCVYLGIRLVRRGTAHLPKRLKILGFIFIIGGPLFDIGATLYHTPGLQSEGNPIASVLLDSGYPLSYVYIYAAVCQGLLILLLCIFWVGLLRHRKLLLSRFYNVHSPLTLLKVVAGGDGRTWRQFFLPLRSSHLPRLYMTFWLLAVVLIALGVERWYLGLEWLGFVYGLHIPVSLSGMIAGVSIYLIWLWKASRRELKDSNQAGKETELDFRELQ